MKRKLGLAILLTIPFGTASASKPKPQVQVQKATMTKVDQTLLFPALVKSRVESNIKADEDLIVIRSHVSLGQKVKKGDVLLELRNQDTSLNFHNRLLRSPVSGVVAALMVGNGEYIQKGQQLALINDPSNLFLKIELPVTHHADVHRDMKAEGMTQQLRGSSFRAKVTGIGAVLDTSTGTVPLELEFTSPVSTLLPGTITSLKLFLSTEEKLLIPEKALYYSGDKIFLPLFSEGKVKKVEVKTRPGLKGEVEVVEGLTPGTEVIVGAGEFLKDGELVDVMKK
jgi:membrane fusion protein (multidrug efflux system)